MMRFVKVVALLLLLFFVAALVAPMALRGKVAEVVRREVSVKLCGGFDFEKLDISFLRHFPSASVEIKRMTLTGAGRFASDTLIVAKRMSLVIDMLSLFDDGGFEVSKVFLSSPIFHARKHTDGAVNWHVLNPAVVVKDSVVDVSSVPPLSPLSSLFRLAIHDIRISNGSICYRNDSTKVQFTASSASLRLRGDLTADAGELDLRMVAKHAGFVSGGIQLLRGAEMEFNAVIAADLQHNRFTFSRNMLRMNAIEIALDGWVQASDNSLSMDLKAGCDKVHFKDLLSLVPAFYMRDFHTLAASGELSVALWAKGELREQSLPAFELKTEVHNGTFQYSSLPNAVTNIDVVARVANPGGGMDLTTIDLSTLRMRMAGNALSATFSASNLVSDPHFQATIVGRVDLGDVKEVYPLEEGVELSGVISTDVRATGRLSDLDNRRYEEMGVSGTIIVEGLGLHIPMLPALYIRRAAATVTPQSMTLGEFGVRVGHSDLSAKGQLTGYLGYLLRGSLLSGRLYVKSDLLDLNEIMAASRPSEQPSSSSTSSTPVALVPINIPSNLDLSLHADLRKVFFGRMLLTDLLGEMRASEGSMTLYHITTQLFGGRATVSGYYAPTNDVKSRALGLKLGIEGASFVRTHTELEFLPRIAPIFANTSGDYSLNMNLLTTVDGAMSPDLTTLEAQGELTTPQARIQRIGAFDLLAKSLGESGLSAIEAKDLSLRFVVDEGRIATEPFVVMMGGFDVTLSGTTGLDEQIDYTARVALPGGIAGGLLESVAVHIGGSFSAPKLTLGAAKVEEQTVKMALDLQIDKLMSRQ